jgi:8-oxo-dGTP diphosphatase
VAGGVERSPPQVAAIVAELSGPVDEPDDTAGPGGRPEDTAGPGGRPEDTAGPGGRPEDTDGPGGRPEDTAGPGGRPENTEPVVAAAGGVVWRLGLGDQLEVALVHRPRYDDWSLPKGKLDSGEDHATAALREVEEETGLRCGLDEALPVSRYRDRKGRPKVVRYWLMHPLTEATPPRAYTTGEVDEAVWRPVGEAKAMATYERDRELLDIAATLVRART